MISCLFCLQMRRNEWTDSIKDYISLKPHWTDGVFISHCFKTIASFWKCELVRPCTLIQLMYRHVVVWSDNSQHSWTDKYTKPSLYIMLANMPILKSSHLNEIGWYLQKLLSDCYVIMYESFLASTSWGTYNLGWIVTNSSKGQEIVFIFYHLCTL